MAPSASSVMWVRPGTRVISTRVVMPLRTPRSNSRIRSVAPATMRACSRRSARMLQRFVQGRHTLIRLPHTGCLQSRAVRPARVRPCADRSVSWHGLAGAPAAQHDDFGRMLTAISSGVSPELQPMGRTARSFRRTPVTQLALGWPTGGANRSRPGRRAARHRCGKHHVQRRPRWHTM